MARATHLVVEASGTALDGGVRFPGEFSIMADAFYMLANVHHQIATGEVFPPLDRFWYYLSDLPFRIQNVAASF